VNRGVLPYLTAPHFLKRTSEFSICVALWGSVTDGKGGAVLPGQVLNWAVKN